MSYHRLTHADGKAATVRAAAAVRDVLRCCKEELDRTMAACGCTDVASTGSRLVSSLVDLANEGSS